MTTKERKAIMLQHRQRHIEQLQALGYIKNTMHAIKRLEHYANEIQTRDCNGELSEEDAKLADEVITSNVKRLFGGKLPHGFFINGDPRGYTLKLDNEAYEKPVDFVNGNDLQPIGYTDWGGYMILAPEEF